MKKLFSLVLISCIILNFSFALFAQEEEASVKESLTEVRLVTAIEVEGNKFISTNKIISKMKTRISSPYQENIVSDDLKRLYLLGFFSDIKIDTEDYKEGVKITVRVVERPIIEKVELSGIRRLTVRQESLKEELKTRENQHLDYPSLAEDVRTLKKMYEKKGFSDVVINHQVDIDKETNKAKVKFVVSEGKKVRIKNIFVEGNLSFLDKRILRLIKTKRAWWLNAGILKDDLLTEDMERIRAFYRKEGFTDVEVDYEIKSDERKPYLLYITIKIKEGKRYLVGNVAIQGNKDLSRALILARLEYCVPGKVFSQEALKADIANIQSLYFDKGYISNQIEEATSLNSYTGRVDIVYNIAENEIVYVDKIRVVGNVKTKDVVVRRELRIYPGDRFDGDKLKRSKERIQNLGFFEEVGYDAKDTGVPSKKDLIVEVKESKTGAFSFGGGYSTVDQFVGFIEIEQKNFDWKNFPYFTGAGQDLRLRASFGSVSSGFDLSFTDPWIFDYPVSFGFDLYKRQHEREEDIGYGYDQDITGGDIRLGTEVSEYVRANLSYRYDNIKITDVVTTASSDLKSEEGENVISSLRPGITFDTRDNVFYPRKGNFLSSSFEWAGGPFGGDKEFLKYFGTASQYFPLFKNSALEFKARVGLVEGYSDTEKVPIYERFFAGGASTVRGYEERSLGPIDPASKDPLGGESMLVGNIEYTHPVLDFLKAAVFYDIGNVWGKMNDIGSGGLKSSVGLGFRIKTPIGPNKLDYGVPLDTAPGEEDTKSGKFHFSAGHAF
ncbi:MAG: outer membrane protein assembly factor BamA [Candidatus Omnitrophica bacterium]|nr:outer membrane protein assembly factor BamA [Candidatus Omnitrophota bacterium]